MKKHYVALALSAGAAMHAHAQSTVTLYGIVDVGISYQTHTNPAGSSTWAMQQGNEGFLSGSRFGLTGKEDIGGGWYAGFTLENGFLANNGKLDQQGQLFGRQAFVKLGQQRYGELALGRQYTTANTMLYYVDPLGVGAAPTNSWQVFMTGQRYDNAVSYTGNYGPLQAIVEYAMGGIAGDTRARSSISAGLKYAQPSVTAIVDVQQTNDTQDRYARIYLAGVKVPAGPVDLYANYLHSDREAGFDSSNGGEDTASITSMASGSPTAAVAINRVFASHRRDDFFTVGAGWHIAPQWQLIGAGMYDRTLAQSFSGTRTTAYGVLDYSLSKRTDVYFAAAYERVTGGWAGLFGNTTTNAAAAGGAGLNGRNEQVSTFAGLRHRF
ncbi:porin [Paraburkholderia pallida]|uniref:Porin n=1 Tax=Paraburkholderia pallida TaxID=2547399 RepID=A0A4V1AZP2_9BURK|nr:porin [Paraburkholderia pallida]QBQ99962.1 porin [Paraburkholderia pallida]